MTMHPNKPSVFGTIQKIIASTPNANFDEEAYQVGVIEPARALRALAEQLDGEPPTPAQLGEAMAFLRKILETKQVAAEERDDNLRELLDLHDLHAVFPDLSNELQAPGEAHAAEPRDA